MRYCNIGGSGAQDLDAYAAEYQLRPLTTEAEAAPLQERTTVAQLGIRAEDDLRDSASLPTRIIFLNTLTAQVNIIVVGPREVASSSNQQMLICCQGIDMVVPTCRCAEYWMFC